MVYMPGAGERSQALKKFSALSMLCQNGRSIRGGGLKKVPAARAGKPQQQQ